MRGRHYSEVARITSRICGICSVGHTLASVKATEAALGIEVTRADAGSSARCSSTPRTSTRHVLHVYILVAPDLLGAPSVFPLVRDARRGGRARAAPQAARRTSGARSSAGAPRTRRPSCPAASRRCRPSRSSRRCASKLVAAVPGSGGDARDGRRAGARHPGVRPAHRVHGRCSDDEDYGLYDGYVQTILPDGDRAALRGRRLPQLHQRVRRAAVDRQVHARTGSTATRPARSRASTTTTTSCIPRPRRSPSRSACSRSAPTRT